MATAVTCDCFDHYVFYTEIGKKEAIYLNDRIQKLLGERWSGNEKRKCGCYNRIRFIPKGIRGTWTDNEIRDEVLRHIWRGKLALRGNV
jgi:hypothetical protein